MSRNSTTEDIDRYYKSKTGVSVSGIVKEFFGDLDRSLEILEVGCNIGLKLGILQKMGFTNLNGVELNETALKTSRKNFPGINFFHSDIEEFETDKKFDLVFTFGVLIHLNPEITNNIIKKIHSLSSMYIFGHESYSKELQVVNYRSYTDVFWKQDFMNKYIENFPTLSIIKQKLITYTDNNRAVTKTLNETEFTEKDIDLQDSVYLLKK